MFIDKNIMPVCKQENK